MVEVIANSLEDTLIDGLAFNLEKQLHILLIEGVVHSIRREAIFMHQLMELNS